MDVRHFFGLAAVVAALSNPAVAEPKYNVLFIITDDLTSTVLGCYGNTVCQTPNIDSLAAEGVQYTRAYCQYAVCGPSRASLMFSYYPHTTDVYGYVSGRSGKGNANRETWSEYFKNRGYYSARVSKIYHMDVPATIIDGNNGSDDANSWTERFNAQGGEAEATFAAGNLATGTVAGWEHKVELLQGYNNVIGTFPGANIIGGGNKYEYVITPEEDPDLPWDDPSNNQQSDGKAAKIACELIEKHKNERFFLAVGFVRPHIPFVAPKSYFEMYPWAAMVPPYVPPNDQDDLIWTGVTTASKKFNDDEKKKSIAGYYASTTYMDDQVGRVLQKLEDEGLEDNTIVIFTSDHGYFLGEHDLWSKEYVHEESARVPLIIKVPGKAPAVCGSLFELLDLYPTIAELCGLPVPSSLQGISQAATIDDPSAEVRFEAFTVLYKDVLLALRDKNYTFIQKKQDASGGYELYDMVADPYQFTNVAANVAYASVLEDFKDRMARKLTMVTGHSDDHALWLPFNQKTGLTTFDANGMERGTLIGFSDPTSHWVTGKHNMACNFSNSNQYIDVSGFIPPSGTLDRTMSAWINTTSNGTISSWGSTAVAGGGWDATVTTNGKFQIDIGEGSITSQTTVNDGLWHHVAAVFKSDRTPDADDVQLYIDGQLETAPKVVAQTLNTSAEGLIIGKHLSDGGSSPGVEAVFTTAGAVNGAANYVATVGGITMTMTPESTWITPATIGFTAPALGVTGGTTTIKPHRTVGDGEKLIISFDQDVLLRGWDTDNTASSEKSILTSPAFAGLSGVTGMTYHDATDSLSHFGTAPVEIDDDRADDGILVPHGNTITFTVGSGHTVSYYSITVASVGAALPTIEGNAFSGKIDEFRLETRALTQVSQRIILKQLNRTFFFGF